MQTLARTWKKTGLKNEIFQRTSAWISFKFEVPYHSKFVQSTLLCVALPWTSSDIIVPIARESNEFKLLERVRQPPMSAYGLKYMFSNGLLKRHTKAFPTDCTINFVQATVKVVVGNIPQPLDTQCHCTPLRFSAQSYQSHIDAGEHAQNVFATHCDLSKCVTMDDIADRVLQTEPFANKVKRREQRAVAEAKATRGSNSADNYTPAQRALQHVLKNLLEKNAGGTDWGRLLALKRLSDLLE